MAQNQWFRLYNQSLNNPKVQNLSGDMFKAWINILCVTSQCDGRDVTRDDLSFHLRMSQEQTNQIVDELVAANLLVDNGEIIPYKWDERQYKSDSSTDRTRLYRERKKNESDGKCDVTVTPSVTPPDTESDTDIKRATKKISSSKAKPIWTLSDNALLKLAEEKGIGTHGKSRQELLNSIER